MARTLYPILTQPVLPPTLRAETVTESRWHEPFSVPVRRAGLAAAVVAASGAFWAPFTPAAAAETVTLDKWHQPLSVPVKARPIAEEAALSLPPGETVTLDKWLAPLSGPARRAARQYGALSYGYFVSAAAETVTVDKWLAPFGQPSYRRQPSDRPSFVKATPFAEAVSVDRWLRPLSTPARSARLVPALFSDAIAVGPAATTSWSVDFSGDFGDATVTPDITWLTPLSSPRRLSALSYGYFVAASAPETVTLDKWHQPLSVPVRRRAFAEEGALSFVKAAPFPETVSVDRWLQPFSGPVLRVARQYGAFSYGYFVSVSAETVTVDKWLAPFAQPRSRRLVGGQVSFVKGSPFAETVSVDRWLQPLAVPVRGIRRGSERSSLSFVKAAPFVVVDTVSADRWFQPLTGPVRRVSWPSLFLDASTFHFAIIAIIPAPVEEVEPPPVAPAMQVPANRSDRRQQGLPRFLFAEPSAPGMLPPLPMGRIVSARRRRSSTGRQQG